MAIDFKKFLSSGGQQTGEQPAGSINLSKFLPSGTTTPTTPETAPAGQIPQQYTQMVMENGKMVPKTVTVGGGQIKQGNDTRTFNQKILDAYNFPTTTPADKAGNVIDTALNEGQLPYGFDWIRKVIKGGYQSVQGSIGNAVNGANKIIDNLDSSGIPLSAHYTEPGYSTVKYDPVSKQMVPNPDYEKELQVHADYLKKAVKSPLQRGVAMGEGVVRLGSLYFTQVMAELNAAKELPGPLSWPAKAVDWGFTKLGQAGSWASDKGVDFLPVSQETKDTIKPLAEELGAFLAQMIGVHLVAGAAKKGLGEVGQGEKLQGEFTQDGQNYVVTEGGDVMTKQDYAKSAGQTGAYKYLPFTEDVKQKVNQGVQIGAGFAMNPFSTAFSLANGKIMAKVAEIKSKGKEVTPEDAKKIIEEVKQEVPAELGLNQLPQNESKGLQPKPKEISDMAMSNVTGDTLKFAEAENLVNSKFKPEDAAAILQDIPETVVNHESVVNVNDLKRKIELTAVQRQREGNPLTFSGPENQTGVDVNKFLQSSSQEKVDTASQKLSGLAKYYQRDGGFSAGKETPNPLLRDMNETISTTEGRAAAKKTVDEAVKSGALKVGQDGKVTLYRVGEPSTKNPLVSTTYDKAFAQQFSDAVKGAKINEIRVNLGDLSYFIGGPEKEVLVPRTVIKEAMKAQEPVGTGETKVRGLSAGVEEKAVANKLVKDLGDLPEYRTVNMKDQARRAEDILNTNPEKAKEIAMGNEPPPKGVIPEAVFNAVENRAIEQGDVQTIRDLAHSKLTAEATAMGQRIRTLAERNPESPVEAIKQIELTREKAVKNKVKDVAKETEKIKGQIKDEIKKVGSTKKTWESFVDSLSC